MFVCGQICGFESLHEFALLQFMEYMQMFSFVAVT